MVATDDIAARYGRTPQKRLRERWLVGSVAAAFVVVFAAWVIWAGLDGTTPTIDTQDVSHTIIDEHSVSVTFDVTMPPGTAASCAVQALNETFKIVGWKVIDLPASTERARNITEVVTTSQQSNTGLIYRCWLT